MTLLSVRDLTIRDKRNSEVLINNISFEVEPHSCLGIVGESGSGKTIACKSILGLTSPWLEVTGDAQFDGINLVTARGERVRHIRGKRICMVLQDSMTAFNPLYTMGSQMVEVLCEKRAYQKKTAQEESVKALCRMHIHEPENVLKKYAHQLSGGMLQRCMIALAMALEPDIIIADEPTTALDSINQLEVIRNFKLLQEITGMALIFISHDLAVVQQLAQQLLVMQRGEQVEYGSAEQIFTTPQHEYTRHLVNTRRALTSSFRQAMMPEQDREYVRSKRCL